MLTLQQVMSPCPTMQSEVKDRGITIKLAFSIIDLIYEWTIKYPNAPEELPRKGWITALKVKVDIRIKM